MNICACCGRHLKRKAVTCSPRCTAVFNELLASMRRTQERVSRSARARAQPMQRSTQMPTHSGAQSPAGA